MNSKMRDLSDWDWYIRNSLAGGLHEPDPLRQSCHGCLQQVLVRPGLQLSGCDAWMGIRDQEVHKNSRELGGEVESGEPFLFLGVAVSNHYWFTACPFQQIGICNDLQSLIFSENTRDDGPGKMNPCCFLICRFSQARIIQPAPGTGFWWFWPHFQVGAHGDNPKR